MENMATTVEPKTREVTTGPESGPPWYQRYQRPLLIALGLAASPRISAGGRASAMALGLFTESAIGVHLANGAVVMHFHYFVMLCVLALYEDFAILALGVAYVVVQHGLMGSLGPRLVYGHDGGNAHPWHMALVHGLFVLGAAAALIANWRAHAVVRLSERRHRREVERYLEIAGVLHLFLDAEGRVGMANPMTLETLGRTKDEFIGADWFDVAVPADEREARRAGFAAMKHGTTDRYEIDNALLCADGSIRLVQWVVTIVRDDAGVVTGTLSSGTDVTERRAIEARLDRERRDLATLRRMAQDVASLEDARQALVDAAADLTDAAIATMLEPAHDDDAELAFTTATLEGFVGDRIRIGREPSAAATAFVERRPVFVADEAYSRTASRRLFNAAGAKSVLCQPIVTGGEVLGVLVVGWSDPRQALEERPAELVRLAADEAARALQRRAAMHRLASAALNDVLTGVPNRRAFDAELPRAIARAARTGEPLALATMDLNGFKALNDRDGHAAGDRVLKEVAAAWQNALRTTDLLARIGGDEFVALLPMCGRGDMEVVAERLRGAVTHGPGSGLGIVQWDGAESATELVRRADEALYADKARGASARLADPVRLAALGASGLLDARAQPELDEISRMVTWLLDVPVATVTLVDDHRQFFAGACGLTGQVAEDRETPLSKSFCQHAVSAGRPLIVADAREVPLLRDNPAIDELGVIAYAGIPLIDGSDNVLGVLCAVDHEPRAWSDDDIATLRRLAQRAIGELAQAAAAPPA